MEETNKKIFKNTAYLYIRQLVIMGLSFFTTRIVLEKLGANDFGVNNVVAGFVSMFTLVNSILQTSTSRFLSLNLGKNNDELIKRTFSTAFYMHLIIAVIVVLLLESFGIWFLNTKLNIPTERMFAANVVFQLSVFSVFIGITQTPYTAILTSHEHFNMYAYMSIFDVVAKLVVLFLLIYIPFDKLIVYTSLQTIVNLIVAITYRIYCLRKFKETHLSKLFDKSLCKEMTVFSGWGVVGNLAVTLNSQGLNILINIFFTTIVNAALGLANRVNFTILAFVGGFMTAAQPQLVKYYGANDMKNFHRLIFNVSQYSLFMLAIIGVPVLMEIDYVLNLWLTEVPEYTSAFIKITIFNSIISYSNRFVDQGLVASNHMKELNLYSSTLYLAELPLMYIALKLGASPTFVYAISCFTVLICLFINVKMLSKFTNFPGRQYIQTVFLKTLVLILIACIPPYLICITMPEGFFRFLIVCSVSVLSTMGVLMKFALSKESQYMVKEKIKKILHIKRRSQREINQQHCYDYPAENNGWHKVGNKPVYGNHETESVFDPFVIKHNGKFLMIVSERKYHGLDLLESSNGTDWQNKGPIMKRIPNTWETLINRASLAIVDNVWHLWYTGQSPEISKIGHAISTDGIHYHRSSYPCLEATLPQEGVSVMNPCVLWNEDKKIFQMWYAAGENYEPDVLFYAESKNGEQWIKHKQPILFKDKTHEWEKYKVGGCDVKRQKNSTYIMYYIGYQNLDVTRICYAVSSDGINWTRPDYNICISPSQNSWDSDAIYKPTVLQRDQTLYMWYNGRKGVEEYIGMAIKENENATE